MSPPILSFMTLCYFLGLVLICIGFQVPPSQKIFPVVEPLPYQLKSRRQNSEKVFPSRKALSVDQRKTDEIYSYGNKFQLSPVGTSFVNKLRNLRRHFNSNPFEKPNTTLYGKLTLFSAMQHTQCLVVSGLPIQTRHSRACVNISDSNSKIFFNQIILCLRRTSVFSEMYRRDLETSSNDSNMYVCDIVNDVNNSYKFFPSDIKGQFLNLEQIRGSLNQSNLPSEFYLEVISRTVCHTQDNTDVKILETKTKKWKRKSQSKNPLYYCLLDASNNAEKDNFDFSNSFVSLNISRTQLTKRTGRKEKRHSKWERSVVPSLTLKTLRTKLQPQNKQLRSRKSTDLVSNLDKNKVSSKFEKDFQNHPAHVKQELKVNETRMAKEASPTEKDTKLSEISTGSKEQTEDSPSPEYSGKDSVEADALSGGLHVVSMTPLATQVARAVRAVLRHFLWHRVNIYAGKRLRATDCVCLLRFCFKGVENSIIILKVFVVR